VQLSATFDVAPAKIGLDLCAAITAPPNNALVFAPQLEASGVGVRDGARTDVAVALREADADVVVSLLPTGADAASEHYAAAAIEAGCAFVNATPARIARSPEWAARFEAAGLPLIGDDLKSRFGTTVVHRAILDALASADVRVTSTFQLNAGGNEDFRALEDSAARAAKQATKTAGMAPGAPRPRTPAPRSFPTSATARPRSSASRPRATATRRSRSTSAWTSKTPPPPRPSSSTPSGSRRRHGSPAAGARSPRSPGRR
jgi:myo-inositol-1-phosphate synthase